MTTATDTSVEPDLTVGDDLPVIHIWDGLSRTPKCGVPLDESHTDCPGFGTWYDGQEACVFCGRPICDPCRRRTGWFRRRKERS